MNRLSTILALGLTAGAVLLGSVSQAQNSLSLKLDAANTADINHLKSGDIVLLDGIVSPGTSAGKPVTLASIQTLFVYNPNIFDIAFTPGNDPTGVESNPFPTATNNKKVTFVANTITYSAWNYTAIRQGSDTALPLDTIYGTYKLTVKSNSPNDIGTDLGYSNALLQNVANASRTKVGSNPSQSLVFNPGVVHFSIGNPPATTPGPSSLLVFAMGAAPALGALRMRLRARRA